MNERQVHRKALQSTIENIGSRDRNVVHEKHAIVYDSPYKRERLRADEDTKDKRLKYRRRYQTDDSKGGQIYKRSVSMTDRDTFRMA